MNAAQRRKTIMARLAGTAQPLSASALAAELGVSRQIVVGDVALLRAGGAEIDATPRGYQLHPTARGYTGILACGRSFTPQWIRAAPWWMWRWKTRSTASCGAT